MTSLSIIIPTCDRPAMLASALAALAAMDAADLSWQVIVVDDGSTPPVTVDDELAAQLPQINIIRETGRGPAAARNAGAGQARGDVLVFIDDDCAASRHMLCALAALHKEQPDALIGGCMQNAATTSFWASVTQALMDAAYDIQERKDRKPRRFSTSILAVPRRLFLDMGGFDESFPRPGGEDYEFCERWQNDGRPALYADQVIVKHNHPLTMCQFARQHMNYGRGLLHCHGHARQREQRRSLGSTISDVAAMVTHPFASRPSFRGAAIAMGIVFSQLFTAMGATAEAMSGRSDHSRAVSGANS